jgi:ribosome-binding factor A
MLQSTSGFLTPSKSVASLTVRLSADLRSAKTFVELTQPFYKDIDEMTHYQVTVGR